MQEQLLPVKRIVRLTNIFNAMNKLSVLAALFVLSFICMSGTAQDVRKGEKKIKKEEQYQNLLKLINTQQYAFRGDKALPQSGPQIDLINNDNFLRINKENATADMPYFGRAYRAGYSTSDVGVKFDGPMLSYAVNQNDKKHRITINFNVKVPDDTYRCTLTVSSMNSASLSVISDRRQIIRYTGVISELTERKTQRK